MKKHLPALALAALLLGGLGVFLASEGGEDYPLGDGYYAKFVGGNSLLHQAGNSQLWRNENTKNRLIWPFTVGKIEVTNGFAVFNGGLSDERKWITSPALFVADPNGNVVEFSAALTRQYCRENNLKYDRRAHDFVYRRPALTNGVFWVAGQNWAAKDEDTRWIQMSFGTNRLSEIISEVKAAGTKGFYRGGQFYKEP